MPAAAWRRKWRARERRQTRWSPPQPGSDEVALYTFDTTLKDTPVLDDVLYDDSAGCQESIRCKSLWDAIADTAQGISDRQRRRALV